MKQLVFDPSYGCAGDMILGAFISAGVSFDELRSSLEKLNLDEYSISMERTLCNDIQAVRVNVEAAETSTHRHLRHIAEIIDKSTLSESVKADAMGIFERLAAAEAEVHATTPDKIHFHEVGAVDAIVDIVGACICVDILRPEQILSRPFALGAGTVRCQHGVMPVPSPATVNLVKGFPVRMYNINSELTTPTGAAIVRELAEPLYSPLEGSLLSVGYGAGTRSFEDHPNLMRILVLEHSPQYRRDTVMELCTNIDDMNPQAYSYLFERLFDCGALDVYLTSVQMKKNRPGHMLTVLCDLDKCESLQNEIFAQTSTSGIRVRTSPRVKLPRTMRTVSTPLGECHVKVFEIGGRSKAVPEYESVKKIADSKRMPYLQAYDEIMTFLINMKKEQ